MSPSLGLTIAIIRDDNGGMETPVADTAQQETMEGSSGGHTRTRWIKRLSGLLFLLTLLIAATLLYTSSLIGVEQETIDAYRSLKAELVDRGYEPRMFVISGRRYQLDNKLLATFGGASRKSRHLRGQAIDVVVLDVNRDGVADRKDVDLVYGILDRKIIGSSGGVGTYKNEADFFSRQMVHFDLRGRRARWHR